MELAASWASAKARAGARGAGSLVGVVAGEQMGTAEAAVARAAGRGARAGPATRRAGQGGRLSQHEYEQEETGKCSRKYNKQEGEAVQQCSPSWQTG